MVFRKKEEVNFEKVETLIGSGTHMQGVISSQGTIRIDGSFTGEIKSQGDVVIGENGVLEANVESRNILIAGEIKGNLIAQGKAEITPTGKVIGDIKVKNLIIDEGAVFIGSSQMDTSINKNSKQDNLKEAAK
ncbi:MAG: bactofilin family protein [Peptococcales bacterium]|jgi:cytoskeletal protein CcmA (bactofilin family)